MTYNADVQWAELDTAVSQTSRVLMLAMRVGLEKRKDWDSFANGRSDSTLATYFDTGGGGRPGTTTADVADMRQAFVAFSEVYDFCNDVASPVQGDRFDDWRKFT